MKIIINENRIAALAEDSYAETGFDQAVIGIPDGFDPERIAEYRFEAGELIGPGVYPSLDARKADALAQIEAQAEARSQGGFEYDFGGEYGTLTMQTRASDLPNWLGVAQLSSIRVSQGLEAEPYGHIRTKENINVPVTNGEAQAAMLAMGEHRDSILRHSWALKDAVRAADDAAALDEIDITAGWPGGEE